MKRPISVTLTPDNIEWLRVRAQMERFRSMSELLDQLINLYQQKLNTLKQLQTEMNKTNTRYKQSRGPVDSTRTYFLNL